MAKITKSINLQPGETFVLPPNSTVLGITGNMSSTCGELPEPESLQCYGVYYAVGHGSSPSEPLDEMVLKGFKINGSDYLFSPSFTHDAGVFGSAYESLVISAVNTNSSLVSIIRNICAGRTAGGSNNGGRFLISFKSVPSLISGASLIAEYSGGPLSQGGNVQILLPVFTRQELITQGLDANSCPCS
jgi:hypothetical protein